MPIKSFSKKSFIVCFVFILFFQACDSPRISDTQNLRYFGKSLEHKKIAMTLAKKMKDENQRSPELLLLFDSSLAEAIKHAKRVDTNLLNDFYPEFGNHYTIEYIDGLERVQLGFSQANMPKMLEGQILLDRFHKWYETHVALKIGNE